MIVSMNPDQRSDMDDVMTDAELLEKKLEQLAAAKEEKAEVEERIRKLQDGIVAEMLLTDSGEVEMPDGRKAVLVQPERTVIDEPALKKKLGAKLYGKIVKTTVDKDKLEVAVQAGEVDLLDVASVTTVVPSGKYIRFVGRKS